MNAFEVRKLTFSDIPYVLKTYYLDYLDAKRFDERMFALQIYEPFKTMIMADRLDVLIAYPTSEPDEIAGFYAALKHPKYGNSVVYLYTKENYRRLGVATLLFNTNPATLALARTREWVQLLEKTQWKVEYI